MDAICFNVFCWKLRTIHSQRLKTNTLQIIFLLTHCKVWILSCCNCVIWLLIRILHNVRLQKRSHCNIKCSKMARRARKFCPGCELLWAKMFRFSNTRENSDIQQVVVTLPWIISCIISCLAVVCHGRPHVHDIQQRGHRIHPECWRAKWAIYVKVFNF